MRCQIRSKAGYYTRRDGKPAWTLNRDEAKTFRTKKIAEGVIRILKGNRIKGWIEELPR